MLRSNINHSEADRLLKMRGDFFVRRGGPLSDVYSDGERYNAFLVALEVEIKEHPEAVFQAPLPAAPQEIKVELPSVDEIGSLFMVMMS